MSVRLTRSQLYRWVWTTPAERIGEVLGMSGSTLAKTCKRFDVPTPARGYWRKVQTGHADPATPLPHPEDVRLTSIEVSDEVAADLNSRADSPNTDARNVDAQGGGEKAQVAGEARVTVRNPKEDGAPRTEDPAPSFQRGSRIQESTGGRPPDAKALRRLAEDQLLYAGLINALDRLQARVQEVDPGTGAALSLWLQLARQALAHLDPVEQIVASCHLMASGATSPEWWRAVLGPTRSDRPRRG